MATRQDIEILRRALTMTLAMTPIAGVAASPLSSSVSAYVCSNDL
jgi:hypothetical protein